MPFVGHVKDALLADELVPIEVQRIDRPIGIIRAEHDELGLSQIVAIDERVDDAVQRSTLRRTHLLLNAEFGVILDLVGVLSPAFELVPHLRAHVEYVDDHRSD